MRLTWTANLVIAYGNLPTKATRNKQKAPVPLTTQLGPHHNRLDLKENQLSADVLAIQRRIRESKHQDRNAGVAPETEKKPKDHCSGSTSKHENTAERDTRVSRRDHWEKLKLEEVESCDLVTMDLKGLSPSLLAHPKGASVDYTDKEREMAKALLEKRVSKWLESVPSN